MVVYATLEDLAEAPGGNIDDDSQAMLEIASEMVLHATRNDIYSTDDEGLPSVAFQLEAFQKATLAQVIAWQQTGISLGELMSGQAGISGTVASSGIGSATISTDIAFVSAQDKARAELTSCLSPRAYKILRSVNLISSGVGLW